MLAGTDPADSQVFVTFYTSNLVHNLYLILQGLGSAETTSNAAGIEWELDRLQRCIATINRWTDYCNNREIIVISCLKKHRKIIGYDSLKK